MADKYLKNAINIAEKLIPDEYEGKIYSIEDYSYYSILKGISHIADKQNNKVLIEKLTGIWLMRLPEHSFATPKILM